MAEVIELRGGDPLPSEGEFFVITAIARLRAFEYFIDPSPALAPRVGGRVPRDHPGYASLPAALEAAQALAETHGVGAIYVQHNSVLVRPFRPGTIKPI